MEIYVDNDPATFEAMSKLFEFLYVGLSDERLKDFPKSIIKNI